MKIKRTVLVAILVIGFLALAVPLLVFAQAPRTPTQKRIGDLCSGTLRPANVDTDDGRDVVKATKLYKPGWKAKKVKRTKGR